MSDRDAWVRFACARLAKGWTATEAANMADAMLTLLRERQFDPPRPEVPKAEPLEWL